LFFVEKMAARSFASRFLISGIFPPVFESRKIHETLRDLSYVPRPSMANPRDRWGKLPVNKHESDLLKITAASFGTARGWWAQPRMESFRRPQDEIPRAPKSFTRATKSPIKTANRLAIGADAKGVLRFQEMKSLATTSCCWSRSAWQ